HLNKRVYSLSEMSKSTGSDHSYIGRIERAEVNLTLDMLYKIAEELDCEPHELLPTRASLRV
uniref:helix-turn-helix domain-containing protein n=1 Tax=Shewanella xiamenensis TaxID=332186 RepID=UPI00155918DE